MGSAEPVRRGRQLLLVALLIVALCVMGVVTLASVASAATITMPDPDDFSQGGRVRMVVAKYDGVGHLLDAPFSSVRLYSKQAQVTIAVRGAGHCGVGDTGGIPTRFKLAPMNPSERGLDDGRSQTVTSSCNGADRVLRATAAAKSTKTGHRDYYVFRVSAQIIGGTGGWNSFTLTTDSPKRNNRIWSNTTYHADDRLRKFALKAIPGSGVGNFNLRFARSCTEMGEPPRPDRLYSFDDDAGEANQLYDRPVDTYLYGNGSEPRHFPANAGNGDYEEFHFNFHDERRYRWQWQSIYESNGIQFGIPGDSIDYRLGCQGEPEWELKASSDVNRKKFRRSEVNAIRFNHLVERIAEGPGRHEREVADTVRLTVHWWIERGGSFPHSGTAHRDRSIGQEWSHRSTHIRSQIGRMQTGDKYCEWVTAEPSALVKGKPRKQPVQSSMACTKLVDRPPPEAGHWIEFGSAAFGGHDVPSGSLGREWREAWVGEKYRFHNQNRVGPCPSDPDPDDDEPAPDCYFPYGGLYSPFGGLAGDNYPSVRLSPGNGYYAIDWTHTFVRAVGPSDAGKVYSYIPSPGGLENAMSVYVPFYYRLNPSASFQGTVIRSGTVEQGTPISALAKVQNPMRSTVNGVVEDRLHTDSQQYQWAFNVEVTKPGQPTEHPVLRSEFGAPLAAASTATVQNGQILGTDNLPAGTKVCIWLDVFNASAILDDRRSNATVSSDGGQRDDCVTIVKAPKVQFHNADLHTGRGFLGDGPGGLCPPINQGASISTRGGQYGSWVEYGVFATGSIRGFGSAAIPDGGGTAHQRLMFGNTDARNPGHFNVTSCVPNYFGLVDGSATRVAASTITPSKLSPGPARTEDLGYLSEHRTLTLGEDVIPKGRDIIIRSTGDLVIDGNLFYENNYRSIDEIPRLVLMAEGDIIINDHVRNIDAWLIARGTIYTCQHRPTVDTCGSQLIVNGPVAANQLALRRSYGADHANGTQAQPAEVFNLRPDQILSAYAQSRRDGHAQTVYEVELPPRY